MQDAVDFELDEYDIAVLADDDTVDELIGIVKQEIRKWGIVPVLIRIRDIVCYGKEVEQ